MYQLIESDWRLFKKLLPIWQERYLDKVIEDYKIILNREEPSSGKFWELSNRMSKDKKSPGVILHDIKRSEMHYHILALLKHKIIKESDLEEFSDDLKISVKSWRKHLLKVEP